MANIVSHPAFTAVARRQGLGEPHSHFGRILLAAAAPVLVVGLAWGMVDALAFTQSSLMGLYSATASFA